MTVGKNKRSGVKSVYVQSYHAEVNIGTLFSLIRESNTLKSVVMVIDGEDYWHPTRTRWIPSNPVESSREKHVVVSIQSYNRQSFIDNSVVSLLQNTSFIADTVIRYESFYWFIPQWPRNIVCNTGLCILRRLPSIPLSLSPRFIPDYTRAVHFHDKDIVPN